MAAHSTANHAQQRRTAPNDPHPPQQPIHATRRVAKLEPIIAPRGSGSNQRRGGSDVKKTSPNQCTGKAGTHLPHAPQRPPQTRTLLFHSQRSLRFRENHARTSDNSEDSSSESSDDSVT